MEDEKGVWRTINGAHVFIKDGETAEEAIARQAKEKPKRYKEHRVVVAGSQGRASVQTFGAGGYNIQCFHFRTKVTALK